MAKTLLNSVNDLLIRVGKIDGDSGVLTSLTDSARQTWIDVAVDVINEAIEQLYSTTQTPYPSEQAEDTITLSTNTRNYALASDLVQMRWPLIDQTNTQFIHEHRGGYNNLIALDPERDQTGIPIVGVIRPTDGQLYVWPTPTANENGRVYTYQYDKDLSLSAANDTVPYGDAVHRALIPAAAELWRRDQEQKFDPALFRIHFGRASRLFTQAQPRESWVNR